MQQSIIGKVVDTYQITGILGKGGMGVVYRAKDTTLDRDVALKMMDSNLARDEEFLKRFKSEAKALAKLQNPNIVSVFALRETEIGLALVMEFVDGSTLADQIRLHGPLTLPRAKHIFRQILGALGDAHRNNVIHRDIKPGNVMLTKEDVVKVTDFGLAKIQQASSATMTMGTGGTLYYMSPEQIRGLANVDARGDIYSIGMTLYEAVTGRVPFSNNLTDFDIRQMIVDGKIPPPERFNSDLPKELVQIIVKSIHKDPNKRYQSCEEMWADLEKVEVAAAAQERKPITSEPTPRLPRYKQPPSPRRPLYVTIGIGLVVLAASFVGRSLLMKPTATVSISSTPPASKVTVNGKPMGQTPLTDLTVEAGAVAISVDREGYYRKDTTLDVKEGETLSVQIPLAKLPERSTETLPAATTQQRESPPVTEARRTEPRTSTEEKRPSPPVTKREPAVAPATLVLRVVPSGSVSIDGGGKQTLGSAGATIEVPSGQRTIVFEHPRYGSKRTTVSLKSGERKQLTCYFEGYLSVVTSGDASWGLLVIDGRTTEVQTPIDGYALPPGRHRISVTKMGFEALEGEKIVVVEPSFERRVERLAFTLKRK